MTMLHAHLYHLEESSPKTFSGGLLRGAAASEFPILKGQNASMYSVRLEEGGFRESHWHPDAWLKGDTLLNACRHKLLRLIFLDCPGINPRQSAPASKTAPPDTLSQPRCAALRPGPRCRAAIPGRYRRRGASGGPAAAEECENSTCPSRH